MTRQSKNATNAARARTITAMHKNGEKGPSKTNPQHNKRHGYRDNPDNLKRQAEALKAKAGQEKTSGKQILRNAGNASKDEAVTA